MMFYKYAFVLCLTISILRFYRTLCIEAVESTPIKKSMGCMLNGYMTYGLSTQCERVRKNTPIKKSMGCMLNGYMMYGLSTQCERVREKVGSTGVPGKLEPANNRVGHPDTSALQQRRRLQQQRRPMPRKRAGSPRCRGQLGWWPGHSRAGTS